MQAAFLGFSSTTSRVKVIYELVKQMRVSRSISSGLIFSPNAVASVPVTVDNSAGGAAHALLFQAEYSAAGHSAIDRYIHAVRT